LYLSQHPTSLLQHSFPLFIIVYYTTAAEIDSAFAHIVGAYDYASYIYHPDSATALSLASLQPGKSVLKVGAGSSRFIAEAKQRVSNSYCVAVNAV
jgi:ubiquinone/menaquinone biosynthesis C-methylase UbiE